MQTHDTGTSFKAIALSLGLALAASIPCAAAMAATAGEAPEEIIVTGTQTLTQLQLKIELAQDRMFGLFNEFNDDDRYDIQCIVETRTGTLISQRVCQPEFLRKSIELNARAFLAGKQGAGDEAAGTTAVQSLPPQAEINYRYPLLKEKMNALVERNSAFAEAVAEHHALIEEMERRTSSAPTE
jgi:hypothetical protein